MKPAKTFLISSLGVTLLCLCAGATIAQGPVSKELDPKVVETSKRLVMVRLDQDQNKDLAQKYQPDGGYIPRTLFLTPDGTLDADVHAPRDQYKYFYDEKDPAAVLAGMDAALGAHAVSYTHLTLPTKA